MLMQIFGDKQGALWELWKQPIFWSASNLSGALWRRGERTNFSTSIFQTFQTEVLKGLKGFVVKCFLVKQACSTEQINK